MAVWENGGYLAENGVVFLSQLFPTILPNLALEMVTPNVGEDMHDPCRISRSNSTTFPAQVPFHHFTRVIELPTHFGWMKLDANVQFSGISPDKHALFGLVSYFMTPNIPFHF